MSDVPVARPDLGTIAGLIQEGRKLTDSIATLVSVAYEEVDGRNRPRGSAMGGLLHDVVGKIDTFRSVLSLIEHRHADDIAAERARADQAEAKVAAVRALAIDALAHADDTEIGWDAEMSATAILERLDAAPTRPMVHKQTKGMRVAMGYICTCGRWFQDWNKFNVHLEEEIND